MRTRHSRRWVIVLCPLAIVACRGLVFDAPDASEDAGALPALDASSPSDAGSDAGVDATVNPAPCNTIDRCGSSCAPCTPPPNTTAACDGTQCSYVCNATICGNACVDLATDPGNCATCGHDCQGGGCASGACLPRQLVNHSATLAIEIDSTHIYAVAERLFRTLLDGGDLVTLSDNYPRGQLAIDTRNAYWFGVADGGPATVLLSTPLDGGATKALTGSGASQFVIDETYAYYVLDQTTIMRVALDGSSAPESLASVVLAGRLVGTDATNVYFVVTEDGGELIMALPKAGGIASPVAALPVRPESFVIRGKTAYEGALIRDAGLFAISLTPDSGAAPVIVAPFGGTSAIAVDGDWIYFNWFDQTATGHLAKVLVDGGSLTDMFTGPDSGLLGGYPETISVDSQFIYWAQGGYESGIWRVAK